MSWCFSVQYPDVNDLILVFEILPLALLVVSYASLALFFNNIKNWPVDKRSTCLMRTHRASREGAEIQKC